MDVFEPLELVGVKTTNLLLKVLSGPDANGVYLCMKRDGTTVSYPCEVLERRKPQNVGPIR